MRPKSLLVRLVLFIALLLVCGWLAAAIAGWKESSEYINEFFDTQQTLFARRMAAANLESITAQLPESNTLLNGMGDKGEEEDDALSFAIFDRQGNLLLNDGEFGNSLTYDSASQGFRDMLISPDDDDEWRIIWLNSLDGSFRVAVGQELEYREDMVWEILGKQLFPWLIALPLLLLGILWLVYRALRPLRQVTTKLNRRSPGESAALTVERLPSEVAPLLAALNSLFSRTGRMLNRERAFISDAAHELKTPLAALRVQAEVAALDKLSESERNKALGQLIQGIDRSSHLVEQLLSLSRLEALSEQDFNSATLEEGTGLELSDWQELIDATLHELQPQAQAKHLTVELKVSAAPRPLPGKAGLIALLLRNLLNNAVKYTPPSGNICISLDQKRLSIENSGPGVKSEYLPRLGERFFRPPGQTETGSGLGLSIAQRIAELHGLKLMLKNREEPQTGAASGFIATILFP